MRAYLFRLWSAVETGDEEEEWMNFYEPVHLLAQEIFDEDFTLLALEHLLSLRDHGGSKTIHDYIIEEGCPIVLECFTITSEEVVCEGDLDTILADRRGEI